jgi:hypothetical protein
MLLVIAGHPRSGTTLLRNLCNAHPDLNITMEFGNFSGLWQTYPRHLIWLLRRCYRRRNESFLSDVEFDQGENIYSRRCLFVIRYLAGLRASLNKMIDATDIEHALQRCTIARVGQPGAPILGDKSAFYIFRLDTLVQAENILCLTIYRDCRDVVNSTLQKVRGDWHGRPFTERFDSAAKVSQRWVEAVEAMEKHWERIVPLRYEDLIQNPATTLAMLAERIGVRADGFPDHLVRADRVGKHRQGLNAEELDMVHAVAGPTMARLGYR